MASITRLASWLLIPPTVGICFLWCHGPVPELRISEWFGGFLGGVAVTVLAAVAGVCGLQTRVRPGGWAVVHGLFSLLEVTLVAAGLVVCAVCCAVG